jgi:hypothetical protein
MSLPAISATRSEQRKGWKHVADSDSDKKAEQGLELDAETSKATVEKGFLFEDGRNSKTIPFNSR